MKIKILLGFTVLFSFGMFLGEGVFGQSISPKLMEEAKTIYAQRCVVCHGAQGAGDGAAAAALNPKPRDFRLKEWQASVSDAQIEKIIKLGGAAVGKAPTMPPNPDIASNSALISALRAYIRTLQKP